MYIQDLDEHEFHFDGYGFKTIWETLAWGFELAIEAEEQNVLVLKEEVCIVRSISLTIVSLGIFDEGWGIS